MKDAENTPGDYAFLAFIIFFCVVILPLGCFMGVQGFAGLMAGR